MPVPADFPREHSISSLAGLQPKLAVRLNAATGRFVDGPTDAEVKARYDMCADLITQLVNKCTANRDTKYAALSEVQILERLLAQIFATGWGAVDEMRWVVRQTASQLGWAIPDSAVVLRTMLGETV
jgi:hypothetical protein